jgi:hypothetical protein
MNEEAQRLANHAFGAPLLHVMGYMYDRKAEPWLGNIVGEWFARKYHNAATLVSVVLHSRLIDSITQHCLENDVVAWTLLYRHALAAHQVVEYTCAPC